MPTNRPALALFASFAGFLAAPAPAQQTPPAAAPKEPIEQITITAERRESTVQETPIAVSAFDADALRERGIVDPDDLHAHVPGFFYTEGGGGSPITQIAVRGVGNENVTAGGDPGVAYHFDGVYLGRPTAAATDFFDLERVEVLRGPQGTLYGRNATGGSINVISQKPTEELDAIADLTYGNYDTLRVRVAGGGPIAGDWLKGRVALVRDRHDGYLKNKADDSLCSGVCDDTDEQDVWGARLHLLAELGEDTEVLLTGQYHQDEGAVGQVRLDPFALGLPPFDDIRKIRNDEPSDLDSWAWLINLRAEHRTTLGPLGDVRISGLVSRQKQEWEQEVDNDFTEVARTETHWKEPSDQWLAELQLASAGDSPFEWLLGAFYLNEDVAMRFLFSDFLAFKFVNGGDFTTRSWALFGEAAYDFDAAGPPLTVRLGLRYTNDSKEGDDFRSLTFGPVPPVPQNPFDSFSIDEDSRRVTGRLVGELRPTESVMLYASISKGYKSGGVLIGNGPNDFSTPNLFRSGPNSYGPEDIWAYELGAKTLLFDGRLLANLAAYYSDYDDLQVFILTGFGAVVQNAAKAKVVGVEAELVYVPTDALRLDANLAWADAEYRKYSTADPSLGGPVVSLKGNQLNRVPDWSLTLGAQYHFALGGAGTLTPRIAWHWQDEAFFRPQNLPRDRSAPWDRWDARLIWTGPETARGQFSAELFVRNLEDNDHIMNISVGAGSIGFPAQGVLHPPRTYGVTLGWAY